MTHKPFETLRFPENFWWGTAASAPQTEGESSSHGKSQSTWDRWFELEPEKFSGVGPETTSNVYNCYKEDIQLMKDMHLNSYRTSISWTRLMPDGITVNEEAVQFYRDYFKTLIEHGIEPTINLFHFDMPWWMMEKGGWTNPQITTYFEEYARQCILHFGDLVKHWVTFNEPLVHVECSYISGHHYPAIHDLRKAVVSGYHTILAHAKAIRAMKGVRNDIKVGTVLNLTPVYSGSNQEKDVIASQKAHLLIVRSFLDPMVKGIFPQELIDLLKTHELLIETDVADLDIIKTNTAEFLGVNYYQPMRVQAPQKTARVPMQTLDDLFVPFVWENRRMNPYRGWEIFPEALYDIAMMLKHDYQNIPWYVSENGMGVADEARFKDDAGMIQDDYRIEFIQEHLEVLHRGIQEGSNCFGYHLWTFVDCWSWLNGYTNRYGFISLDLDTQKRTPKKSSVWFKSFIENQSK
ncbi:glycoside hydrolase family 1 protein [Erysipelothrix larvae]|uniref:glycoside hydrolase family 1 protein n=1 Tax=Erysipelothrix larvae TaxID=1514105 RepID=UPI000A759653|nr:glycoside hydrolase family 1 protein [Erysipelothrix larvae]